MENLKQNEKPDVNILDSNFEELRIKYNLAVPRINHYIERIRINQPAFLSTISEGELIKFADKDVITAEDLNQNFQLFRNYLLIIGVKRLTTDDLLTDLELLVAEAPKAPSNLHGILLDDGFTALMKLTWQDNSDNEAGFEVHECYRDYVCGSKESVLANVTEIVTEVTPIPEFNIGDIYSQDYDVFEYSWMVRAFTDAYYSEFSNTYHPNWSYKPVISFNTLRVLDGYLLFNVAGSMNESNYRYHEVWVSYGTSPLGLFEKYPYVLQDKTNLLSGDILSAFEPPTPEFSNDEDYEMLNEYAYVKVRPYSAIMRGELSSVQAQMLKPLAPDNFTGYFNVQYGSQGGDYLATLSWHRNTGWNSQIEVYRSIGSNQNYQLIKTLSHGADGNLLGYSDNLGGNPTGDIYYKLRAVNESGESEFTDEILIETLEVYAPSNLSVTNNGSTNSLSWTNGDTYYQIQIYSKTNTGSYSLLTTVSGSSSTYQHNIGELTQDTTFYYTVRGVK